MKDWESIPTQDSSISENTAIVEQARVEMHHIDGTFVKRTFQKGTVIIQENFSTGIKIQLKTITEKPIVVKENRIKRIRMKKSW